MPNKIRIYNSTYNEIFPVPEGKEEELIARAKKYKMNYEIISSKPIQQNNTPQAVPATMPTPKQSNNKAANKSNQIDLNEIDSDTLISNYNEGVEQAKQMRGQNKEELKRNIYNSKREKDNQDRKKQSPMDELKSNQVTGNIKLATSPTYDAFGRDIATEEQLKAREQLNKNQGAILSNSFLRPDKDGKIPSNTANTEIEKGDTKKRVEMPQMEVDAEGNIEPYGWGENNTDINKKIIQGRAYDKQVAQDRKQEQIQNIEYNTQLAELSNDKEKESLRYKILPDINNLASTELQGLDALTNQGKISVFARNYLSNQISRKAKKMQGNGLNAFDAITNRDNIEGITTLGWISVVRNGVNAHFLNSLGEASPEDKDSYMQAMDLISSADNSTSTSNVGYDILNGVMQSLPYMGEFVLTGGIGALGKEATKSVTKNVAKGLIKSGINKKAAIKIGQYLGANAPKLMAFSVASPFAYKHAQEKAIERVGKDFKLEDIKVSDILEGYAKSAIEFAVEGSGGLMKLGIDKVAGNGRIGSFFSYLKNKTPEQIREIYKATKFNGVGYEFAEEFLQNIVDTMVWDEMTWKEVFDPYNNFITLATCAMIQSPATVIQSGSYIKDKYKIHQDLGVVAADDRLVAKELKRAMSISDQSKRYEAVLNSGISNLKSAKAQKSAIDYVFRSEKMQFQKQVIDEERINTARREVIPIVTGLSYNNSIATVESNEGDKYFIVGETNKDTRLVPVRKIVTEKDANGNEFNRIEGVKRLVDFDKFDASTYLSTPYDEYVNRLVDAKLGNTRLQEQQQEIKAEELGMAVEQQAEAATMQDFQSIQEVQTQSEELGVEDKEVRVGSVVTIIGDSNEGNKRNFSVINTDGINAVVEDNESGLQHTLPLSVLNVEYQLIDKNEKEIKAVENAINGVETAPVEETLQVNTELQTLPTQEETILQEKQQDIYADFPRDKNGEIDVDKLSVEQQLTYAENEVGKDFAVNQATQVKNNLLKQIDSLNKKMPSMSLAKAVQAKKDIAKLEEEVGIYDIYINENSESLQQEEENLDLENKTYSERLSFLEEFAQNDPRAYVLYGIAAGRIKFIWGGERGLAAELGFIRKNNQGEKKGIANELRAKISILSNKGYTADTLGEELAEEFSNIDALQGRDIVIEALSEVNSKKDALLALESSYIKFNPEKDINYIAQLEQEEKANQEASAYENDIIDAYWRYELQNLDEKHKQIAIFAEKIGVPSDLIQGSQSTFDLLTLIEEYNGQNNNTTGNNGSNGVSQSEGTQDSGIEQGVREGESHRGGESEDSNSYQSSKENGLSNIQDEPTRTEVSDDTDKRGNNSEGYGKEQSDNANETLGEQKPQEIRDVSGSSNEESYNVKEESNLPNGNDAIRSEEVYKKGISNTETGESTTSTNEDASQGDSQVGKSSLENQVQSIINKFIEDNNFRFKAVRVISKNSDEYRKKAGNKNVTGWYIPTTNEVVIVYDNLGEDVENEVKKTYLHEILGHKTIREALRKEDYIPLMQLIYDAIPAFYKAEISKNQGKEIKRTVELELSDKGITDKATIEEEYQKRLDEIVANRIEREKAQYKDKIEYADEFLAVFTENYDNLTPESKKTLIDIIKDFFKRVFGIDADNNFFEDLVKLSYEIARGEKTAQGKINKLNSMLNAPAVAELSKEELKVDTDLTEGQKPLSNYKEVIGKHTPKYLFDNYSEAYKTTGYNLVSRFYSEELHNKEGGLRKKYLGDKYFNKETRKLKPLYVAYNSNNEELIGAYLTPEEAYNAAINRDIEGFEVLYFDKTNEIYDLNSFHIYDGEVDWSDENGTLKPDISQRVINKISLLGKEETVEQQKIAELKEKKAKLYAELKQKMNQLNAGLDPELIIKAVEIININAQLGMIKFNQVAKEMIDILGDKIKPFVKDIYNMARTSNDEYAEEFDTREYVDKFDLEKGFDEEIKEEQIIKPKENTINSLGKPIANTEEGLRNFWKWFGDSKVVDSEGLPLVVYHGTDTEFNVFTKKDIGFHFGTEKQANSRLSTLVNNRVKFDGLDRTEVKSKTRKLPVYLKIENILETKDYGNWHNPQSVLEKLVTENIITKKEAWKVINSFPVDRIYATSKENQEYVTKYLQSKGYDGIKYINKYEAKKEEAYSYIAFSPTQIKSIDNIGTFDPENADIRFREAKQKNNDIRFRTKDKSKTKIERFNALLNEEYEDEKEKKKKTFEERKNEIEIAYFNKFKPLKDIHEKLIEDGAYIPFNIYQRTVSVDSRITAIIENLDATLGEDLKESIAKVQKKGFSYDEIGIYFQAQFMPERTAQLIQKRIEKDFILNRIDETIQDLEDKKAKNFMDLVMPAEEIKKANDKIDKSINKLNKAKIERTEKIRKKLQERGLAGEQGLKELMESKGFPEVTPEDYIKMFEKEVGDTELINELNKNKKAIVKFTLDTALRTGQISKEQYAEYTSSENYVPLRGWDITFDDSGEDNIFQSVSKAAKGRKSLAANPINYLYAMAYTAVTFGEKNIIKNNLATLVLMNRSNSNFMDNFGYNTFYSGYLVDEEGNEVPFEVTNEAEFKALEGVIKETLVIRMHKEKFDNLNSQKNPHKYDEEYKKHILTFYDNGIRHELYIEDINLVNAFKSDKLTRAQANMKKATSYVTKFMTSRNISFIPANLIRDIQTTMFLNKYFDDATKDAAFKAQIIKNMGKVGKSVLKGVWKNDWNTDNEIGKIYNEWLLGGGRTGWLQSFKDVSAIEKKIKRNIANTNKAKKWITNRYHFKTTEALAEFSENLVRFSVYYTAIQNGFTKEQSIWFSNDASLNFNLKGAKGNWLRAIYGFWNASLAGFYKVGKFTWENKGKAAATFAFFMAAGFGKWWLDQLDDDEEKRSEYKKQRMFDLFGVGIPMSYDLLPPYRIGYMLADVLFGDMTDTKFGYETAMSFTEIMPEQIQTALTFIAKYNPKRDKIEWANVEDLAGLTGLTPTSLKPLAEIFITNKNFMGQEIQPENRFKDVPHSAKYKEEQVTALDKLVANFLNGIQGFDWKDYNEESKFTSGGGKRIVDVSPAVIHHLVSSYFSGTAQLITGLSDAITMATDEKEDGFNKISGKIPVINRFYIPTNESLPIYKKLEQMQAKYSDLLENHKEIKSVLNDKKSTQEEKAAYRKRLQVLEKNPLYNEAIRYKRREDDIRDLRKQLRLANKLGKYEQANELKMKLDKIDREINQ